MFYMGSAWPVPEKAQADQDPLCSAPQALLLRRDHAICVGTFWLVSPTIGAGDGPFRLRGMMALILLSPTGRPRQAKHWDARVSWSKSRVTGIWQQHSALAAPDNTEGVCFFYAEHWCQWPLRTHWMPAGGRQTWGSPMSSFCRGLRLTKRALSPHLELPLF